MCSVRCLLRAHARRDGVSMASDVIKNEEKHGQPNRSAIGRSLLKTSRWRALLLQLLVLPSVKRYTLWHAASTISRFLLKKLVPYIVCFNGFSTTQH